jgi:hypothetical protein
MTVKLDYFLPLSATSLPDGMAANLKQLLNEISPFADLPCADGRPIGRSLIVDSLYGQIFESWITEARGIYGTDALPPPAGYTRADRGYLRVPYRKVPHISVGSREQLRGVLNAWRRRNPDSMMLLRGQRRQYFTARSGETMDVLYAHQSAQEPSLFPSASRAVIDLRPVMAGWLALVDLYLFRNCPRKVNQQLRRFSQTHDRHALGMALAQHYGLPSSGMDATGGLEVALFFAFHEFAALDTGSSPPSLRREPVLYVFLMPDRFAYSYTEMLGDWAAPMFPRPAAQDSYFLNTGWGYSMNECARFLFAALRLDPKGDFGPLPTVQTMFPPNDPFAAFLDGARAAEIPAAVSRYVATKDHHVVGDA